MLASCIPLQLAPQVIRERGENESRSTYAYLPLEPRTTRRPSRLRGQLPGYPHPFRSSTSMWVDCRLYRWIRVQERPQQHPQLENSTLPAIQRTSTSKRSSRWILSMSNETRKIEHSPPERAEQMVQFVRRQEEHAGLNCRAGVVHRNNNCLFICYQI